MLRRARQLPPALFPLWAKNSHGRCPICLQDVPRPKQNGQRGVQGVWRGGGAERSDGALSGDGGVRGALAGQSDRPGDTEQVTLLPPPPPSLCLSNETVCGDGVGQAAGAGYTLSVKNLCTQHL